MEDDVINQELSLFERLPIIIGDEWIRQSSEHRKYWDYHILSTDRDRTKIIRYTCLFETSYRTFPEYRNV